VVRLELGDHGVSVGTHAAELEADHAIVAAPRAHGAATARRRCSEHQATYWRRSSVQASRMSPLYHSQEPGQRQLLVGAEQPRLTSLARCPCIVHLINPTVEGQVVLSENQPHG
jgi:hypothetical protein